MKTRGSLYFTLCLILLTANATGWNILLRIAAVADAVLIIVNAVTELKKAYGRRKEKT